MGNIFILGHMRSRSSLLCHLLMNNTKIYGIGESNARYDSILKLWWMRHKILGWRKSINRSFYYIDQINHNSKTPKPSLFNKEETKIIFLVRKPEQSIPSIIKLTEQYYKKWTEIAAKEYYKNRLEYLLQLYPKLDKSKKVILPSDQLVVNTDATLAKLTAFLNLSPPLTSNYKTYKFSGIHGDPSLKILEGQIQQSINEQTDHSFPELSLLYQKFVDQ